MISREELLLHSLQRQHLLERTDKLTVVSDLCGLQAQFASNPKYALRIRACDFSEADWGSGLVKIWSFRGTLHAVRKDELEVFLSARGVPNFWGDSWWGLTKEIKPYWSDFIYEQIREGTCGREELKQKCRDHGMDQELLAKVFHGWGGLLKEMCDRGMIAYEIGTAKRFVACTDVRLSDRDEARAAIITRYFRSFGPATVVDCATFTGYKKREVLDIIQRFAIPLCTVNGEGIDYHYIGELSGDFGIPACIYLAGFDQMIMGYKDRSRLMDDANKRDVITNSGIVFPTILLHGRLRARWKKDGQKLIVTPFAELDRKDRDLITERGIELFADEAIEVSFRIG